MGNNKLWKRLLINLITSIALIYILSKYSVRMHEYLASFLGLAMVVDIFIIPFSINLLILNKNVIKSKRKSEIKNRTKGFSGFDEDKLYKYYQAYKKKMMRGRLGEENYENWIKEFKKNIPSDASEKQNFRIMLEYKARNYKNVCSGMTGLCIPMIIGALAMLVSIDGFLEMDFKNSYCMVSICSIVVMAILAKGLDYMKQNEDFINDCISVLDLNEVKSPNTDM